MKTDWGTSRFFFMCPDCIYTKELPYNVLTRNPITPIRNWLKYKTNCFENVNLFNTIS